MRPTAPALIATHLGAAALGWALTDKRPIDEEVRHAGYFTVDATKVLATTVESLRAENRLVVFSYKGNARVRTERTSWWVFGGRQELSVPAVVSYHLDLSKLSLGDVRFDEAARVVTVRLPRVELGDVAFQPENATTVNGGLLTYSEGTVEALRKLNYASARRAMVAQAQQPGLAGAARRQAVADVERYFEIPLRIAGLPDIRVAATFK